MSLFMKQVDIDVCDIFLRLHFVLSGFALPEFVNMGPSHSGKSSSSHSYAMTIRTIDQTASPVAPQTPDPW
jgi:hypothetical protein